MYYFDVFNFSKYAPQKCTFTSQFQCLDFSLTSTQVKFKLANNLGENICVKLIQITNDATPPISCTVSSNLQGSCAPSEFEWTYPAEKDLTFSCAGGGYIPNERVELKIKFTYYAFNTPSKQPHEVNGKINGRVLS